MRPFDVFHKFLSLLSVLKLLIKYDKIINNTCNNLLKKRNDKRTSIEAITVKLLTKYNSCT